MILPEDNFHHTYHGVYWADLGQQVLVTDHVDFLEDPDDPSPYWIEKKFSRFIEMYNEILQSNPIAYQLEDNFYMIQSSDGLRVCMDLIEGFSHLFIITDPDFPELIGDYTPIPLGDFTYKMEEHLGILHDKIKS